MPYSDTTFDNVIVKIIKFLQPKKILDIGVGTAKYGLMCRKNFSNVYSVGIEVEKDYINKFKLKDIYNEIRHCDANKVIEDDIDNKYDLVFLGDVIEHMRKSQGIDLIHFLIYRAKYILIIYPEKFLQNSVNGYNHEAHISVWSDKDFENFRHIKITKEINDRILILVIIEGYLNNKNDLNQIEDIIKQN